MNKTIVTKKIIKNSVRLKMIDCEQLCIQNPSIWDGSRAGGGAECMQVHNDLS